MSLYDFRKENFIRTDDSSVAMEIDGSTTARTFRVTGPSSGVWYGKCIELYIQDETGGWQSARFASLAAALTNGLIIRKRTLSGPTDVWSYNIKRNNALQRKLSLPSPAIDYPNSETGVVYQLNAPEGVAFIIDSDNVLEIVVQDDLTGLSMMRAHLQYGVKL
jgi:hypothetical protein